MIARCNLSLEIRDILEKVQKSIDFTTSPATLSFLIKLNCHFQLIGRKESWESWKVFKLQSSAPTYKFSHFMISQDIWGIQRFKMPFSCFYSLIYIFPKKVSSSSSLTAAAKCVQGSSKMMVEKKEAKKKIAESNCTRADKNKWPFYHLPKNEKKCLKSIKHWGSVNSTVNLRSPAAAAEAKKKKVKNTLNKGI